MRNPVESQGEDDDGVIWDEVKLTPYDKRNQELRKLLADREALQALPELTDRDRRRLAVLGPAIERAQKRFEAEKARAIDDAWRKRRAIDEWRSGEGREEYNASRRSRPVANESLADLTPAQVRQRKLDQTADSKWKKRCRADGWPEERIEAAFLARVRKREAKRQADNLDRENAEAEAQALISHPNFGLF